MQCASFCAHQGATRFVLIWENHIKQWWGPIWIILHTLSVMICMKQFRNDATISIISQIHSHFISISPSSPSRLSSFRWTSATNHMPSSGSPHIHFRAHTYRPKNKKRRWREREKTWFIYLFFSLRNSFLFLFNSMETAFHSFPPLWYHKQRPNIHIIYISAICLL